MSFFADLHIHSKYSIATSKNLCPPYLDLWGRIKGMGLIGTGDFTHPVWSGELKEQLEESGNGVFRLKKDLMLKDERLSEGLFKSPEFVLSAEISNIYKKNGKVRKVHNLVLAPDFKTVDKIQKSLQKIGGNITSDGRPILGMDSRDLLEICLSASEDICFIPAHVWTPWFSALGAKSGFDSIEECYEDLTDYIYAIETGLSSDAPMNWICSILDRFTLLSNSDAHSPEKLGRNCNLFKERVDYFELCRALKKESDTFNGTIDLFPQEGKYHFAGHRKCSVRFDPLRNIENRGICPECRKKVTDGVMDRVATLSDRSEVPDPGTRDPYFSIIPLKEIISEIVNTGVNSKKVNNVYFDIISALGPETEILVNMDISEIEDKGFPFIAEAVRRMRKREVDVSEGFDGEYGKVKVFTDKDSFQADSRLFKESAVTRHEPATLLNFDLKSFQKKRTVTEDESDEELNTVSDNVLNRSQKRAVMQEGNVLVLAGPGSGKTRVLTDRLQFLTEKGEDPESILAVTFTNKAAQEMRKRVDKSLEKKGLSAEKICIKTFHALGYSILKEICSEAGRTTDFILIDSTDKEWILKETGVKDKKLRKAALKEIEMFKNGSSHIETPEILSIYEDYEKYLKENNLFDLEDLIKWPVDLSLENSERFRKFTDKFRFIFVDEFQDINHAQYGLLKSLAPLSESLFVIGDPNQSIYSFRGSDLSLTDDYVKDFSPEIIHLSRSYRCSKEILSASQNILGLCPEDTMLRGVRSDVKLRITRCASDRMEAELIAATIDKLIGGTSFFSIDSQVAEGDSSDKISSLSDFAVLCRTSAQFEVIRKALTDHNIPFQEAKESDILHKEPLKSLVLLIKLAVQDKEHDFLFKRISAETGFKKQDLLRLRSDAFSRKYVSHLTGEIIDEFFKEVKGEYESEFNYMLELSSKFKDDFSRFLNHINIGTGVDVVDFNMEKVSLLTFHASKGLEFEAVFAAGLEDELLPYSLYNRECSIDEEKRLLYVGMTRARKYLFLSSSKKRFLNGREFRLKVSPFIGSIKRELCEIERAKQKKVVREPEQMKLF